MPAHRPPSADAAAPGSPWLPLPAAAALQDDLLVAHTDLERLQRLLADASDALIGHFHAASAALQALRHGAGPGAPTPPELQLAQDQVGHAVVALQFQDLASQLISHTSRRLRSCADRLAHEAMGDDEDGPALVEAAPLRPNPVSQHEVDAGSIELF